MSDDQITRLPPGYRPRRSLTPPKLAEDERTAALAAAAEARAELPKRRWRPGPAQL